MLSISYCIANNVLQRFSNVVYALKRQDRTFHRFGGYAIATEIKWLGTLHFLWQKVVDTIHCTSFTIILFCFLNCQKNATLLLSFYVSLRNQREASTTNFFSPRVNYLLDLQPFINTLILLYLFSLASIANFLIFQLLSSVFQLIVILSCL